MMTSVCPMKSERGEFAYEMIRCPPDLNMSIVGDSNISSIWGELDVPHGLFEVEVVKNYSTSEVDK